MHPTKTFFFLPTGQITRSLRRLANDLSSFSADACNPVPLWITGHSLGAALAGLIYARYLQAPADLGSGVVLRDGYTFGGEVFFRSLFRLGLELTADLPQHLASGTEPSCLALKRQKLDLE